MNYEYCDGVTHTVKKGDTLYEISRKYNVALALLLRANPYVDVFNLQVGDTICIPASQGQMMPYPVSGMMPGQNTTGSMTPQMGGRPAVVPDSLTCKGEPRQMADGMGEMMPEMESQAEKPSMPSMPSKPPAPSAPSGKWEKYVVQPGDTLADVLREMDGDVEKFLEKNDISTIYMLPGVAYYIFDADD